MDPASTDPAAAGCSPIDIIVDERRWRRLVPGADALARRVLRAASVSHGVTVLLSDDRTVRRLNTRDRGRFRPTNVLTYDPPGRGLPGQIVLALQTVSREARAARKRPRAHYAHLLVHGALHLAGHDHQAVGAARRMEMAEARILRRIGLPNPWRVWS